MTISHSASPAQLEELRELHRQIDAAAAELAACHGERLQCRRRCSDCCVDDIEVLEIEAELIRSRHSRLLASLQPHSAGSCALLAEDGSCRVYEDRPAVCRSEGLPLRWYRDEAEYRDICPLNDRGAPLTTLPPEDCWLVGPWEGRLAALQERTYGHLRRLALRALFPPPLPSDV